MTLKIYQVDAFTNCLFRGNPAAVVPLTEWLPDEILQSIAMENNLSETAYFVQKDGCFEIRWFTPVKEVSLCGHATLATAHVLSEELGIGLQQVIFQSKSGKLGVKKEGDFYTLDFPTDVIVKTELPPILQEALAIAKAITYKGREDYLVVFSSQKEVENLQPDFKKLAELKTRGLIATAKGDDVDFVSRCFYPYYGIDEDPVTGSAHTTSAPYWAERLGKYEFTAKQISQREGLLKVKLNGERTLISGQAVTYMRGEIMV